MSELKFYELTPNQRLETLNLPENVMMALKDAQDLVSGQIIENYVSNFTVPMGILKHLLLDGTAYNIPMATEEPSVIAAANHGAKMLNAGGGVHTELLTDNTMVGQILIHQITDYTALQVFLTAHRDEIFAKAQATHPSIVARGGGLKNIELRMVTDNMASIDCFIDTCDAMGANIVNTILAGIIPIFDVFHTQILAGILSNYATQQLVSATVCLPFSAVGGQDIAERIVAINHFGHHDVYRATTENKGLFNGASAVTLATGNDWRALEAAGHAYAAKTGVYTALATWSIEHQQLKGTLTLPVSVGTVGGAISALPQAQNALRIIGERVSANQLRRMIVATGLAQNLAALRAIVSDGIQKGHMRMQYRALALQIGATPDEVPQLTEKLTQLSRVDTTIATQYLNELREKS